MKKMADKIEVELVTMQNCDMHIGADDDDTDEEKHLRVMAMIGEDAEQEAYLSIEDAKKLADVLLSGGEMETQCLYNMANDLVYEKETLSFRNFGDVVELKVDEMQRKELNSKILAALASR